eukprot:1622459-Amphidinium_carterae.3
MSHSYADALMQTRFCSQPHPTAMTACRASSISPPSAHCHCARRHLKLQHYVTSTTSASDKDINLEC